MGAVALSALALISHFRAARHVAGAADFNLRDEQVQALSESGYYAMSRYLKENTGRRYSIAHGWVTDVQPADQLAQSAPGRIQGAEA